MGTGSTSLTALPRRYLRRGLPWSCPESSPSTIMTSSSSITSITSPIERDTERKFFIFLLFFYIFPPNPPNLGVLGGFCPNPSILGDFDTFRSTPKFLYPEFLLNVQ
jgi:hypothetical protein